MYLHYFRIFCRKNEHSICILPDALQQPRGRLICWLNISIGSCVVRIVLPFFLSFVPCGHLEESVFAYLLIAYNLHLMCPETVTFFLVFFPQRVLTYMYVIERKWNKIYILTIIMRIHLCMYSCVSKYRLKHSFGVFFNLKSLTD